MVVRFRPFRNGAERQVAVAGVSEFQRGSMLRVHFAAASNSNKIDMGNHLFISAG